MATATLLYLAGPWLHEGADNDPARARARQLVRDAEGAAARGVWLKERDRLAGPLLAFCFEGDPGSRVPQPRAVASARAGRFERVGTKGLPSVVRPSSYGVASVWLKLAMAASRAASCLSWRTPWARRSEIAATATLSAGSRCSAA